MFSALFSRLVSMVGLSGFVSTPSFSSGSGAGDESFTDGEASFTYTKGQKAALSDADREAALDQRTEQITEKNVVWPGKPSKITFKNEEEYPYRFTLTLTDLEPAYYTVRIPMGGTPQKEGGVLLNPGEETTFEVTFLPLNNGQKGRVRTFSFVISYFDPRRHTDQGSVYADLAAQWVPRPTSDDFRLTAPTREFIARPWRRAVPLTLDLQNLSYLPPAVNLRVVRAANRDALLKGEEVESVGAQSQSLDARTGGKWNVVLPPTAEKKSYVAMARGTARAADNIEVGFELPKPIYVRYVPWLRRGRDWAFLGGSLLGLLWLVWGIPIPKTPIVHVRLDFQGRPPGGLPNGVEQADIMGLRLIPLHNGQPESAITGKSVGNGMYEFELPRRWMSYAYRWPFGWAGHSRHPQSFKVEAVFSDSAKEEMGSQYVYDRIVPENAQQFTFSPVGQPAIGDFRVEAGGLIARRKGIQFHINIASLGIARGRGNEVKAMCLFDGKTYNASLPILESGQLQGELPVDSKKKDLAKVWAEVGDVKTQARSLIVEPREEAYPVTLAFERPTVAQMPMRAQPGQPFTIAGRLPQTPLNVKIGKITVPGEVGPKGLSVTAPAGLHGTQDVMVLLDDGTNLRAGTLAIDAPATPDAGVKPPENTNPPPQKSEPQVAVNGKNKGNGNSSSGNSTGGNNVPSSGTGNPPADSGPPVVDKFDKQCKPGDWIVVHGHSLGKTGQVAIQETILDDVHWGPNRVAFRIPKTMAADSYPVDFIWSSNPDRHQVGTVRVKGSANPGRYDVGKADAVNAPPFSTAMASVPQSSGRLPRPARM